MARNSFIWREIAVWLGLGTIDTILQCTTWRQPIRRGVAVVIGRESTIIFRIELVAHGLLKGTLFIGKFKMRYYWFWRIQWESKDEHSYRETRCCITTLRPAIPVATVVGRIGAVARARTIVVAKRFGLRAVDTTALGTTCWPPIQVAGVVGRMGAITGSGRTIVAHGLLDGAL